MKQGIVYLVGAGPGDPGLVTVKGREVIRAAEVIVYDRLIPESVLGWARPEAERIYVGKLPDRHTLKQEEINALLVEKGLAGKVVCRLKGGDPFVFGRGGEEAAALREAGVPFEVVPGVTSAIAGPAYAGIPVTHRGKASSVAFITGHEDPGKDESAINWAGLATGVDTLVFLMGVAHLPEIAAQLVAHGRSPATPAGLVERGTHPAQRVVTGTLGEIATLAEEQNVQAPALLVVGDVVSLRETLCWFDNRPLSGLRVLVTRTREQASELSGLLERNGAAAIEAPVIAFTDLESHDVLDDCLRNADRFDWLVFTSRNGVSAVRRRLSALGLDVRALKGPCLAAIGSATAEALVEWGLCVDLVPPRFVAESLAEALKAQGIAGKRVLIARALEAREVLPEVLAEAGAEVTVAPCYRTIPSPGAGPEIQRLIGEHAVEVVTFASSSTVKAFVECLAGADVPELLAGVIVACIGPVTAQTARELGLKVDVEAEEFTIEGLVEALAAHVSGARPNA
jgi:uroporphyrinogen III methyltransferase/synthase